MFRLRPCFYTINYWIELSLVRFFADGVLEWYLAHRRYVAVLCMLFKIKSNPMHAKSGALSMWYMPAHDYRGALVTSIIGSLCASSL